MDDKHLLNLAKEICEIINRNRVYNANIITELHANENAHSRILRMFLQYDDGTKNYPVLKRFLEIPKIKNVLSSSVVFKSPYFANEQERIDVLIEEPRSFAVIVENKIKGATDQERQLERYIESVNAHGHGVPYDNIYAIYLTDNGEKIVDECSLTKIAKKKLNYNGSADMGRFIPLNYRYDILPWLEKEVLPNCIEKEELLISALKQYIDYLKCMFGIIENEEQKILIMEKLKKEIGISGNDLESVEKCFKTIEELDCLKQKVSDIKEDLARNCFDENIKKPFDDFLKKQNATSVSDYELVVSFESFNRFDIVVRSKNWEKYNFLVQEYGGMYYGLVNIDKSNPYKVKEGSFNGYDKNNAWWSARKRFRLAELCELDFWKQVRNGDFVKNLIEMFEEVLKNIEMQ